MKIIHNYKDLEIYKLSIELVSEIYILTQKYPKEELFNLTNQMRRAAVSIPSNIAEGFGRGTNPQIVNFLRISQGSSYELDTQLAVSLTLKYINQEDFDNKTQKLSRIIKMNYGLQNHFGNMVN
jgi:four helix bundle protein